MSYILGLDASKWQGQNIDFTQVKAAGYQFWLQRMSYSYPGQSSHIDPTANINYYGAGKAGMVVGGYHKIGWTDPIAEADFFLAAMTPLAEGDLVAHDIEPASDVPVPINWLEWEQAYVQRIYDKTGVWSIRYMNISMYNSMSAQGVVKNCPAWVAAPSFTWDDTVPVDVIITMQQGPTVTVPGIPDNVCDTDAFFGTGTPDELRAELLKLAYHAPQAVPDPAPIPPAPAPVSPVIPTPVMDVQPSTAVPKPTTVSMTNPTPPAGSTAATTATVTTSPPAPASPGLLAALRTHLPYLIGATLVTVNGLIDTNQLTLSPHVDMLLNAVLVALGIGTLHHRQQS